MESCLSTPLENCSFFCNMSEEFVAIVEFTKTETVIITVLMPIILCLGIITNSTFLFVVIRAPRRKSHTTLYLTHLALADLLFLISFVSVQTWSKYSSPVIRQDPFVTSAPCSIYFMAVHLCYISSMALVTMSSYERFLSLCHPLRLHRIRSRRRTYKLIAICWLLGLAIASYNIFLVNDLFSVCAIWPNDDKYLGYPSKITYCSTADIDKYVIINLIIGISLLIIVLLNTYMYICIIYELKKCRSASDRIQSDQDTSQMANRVTKLVLVNGVVVITCQTPYQCMVAYMFMCYNQNVICSFWAVKEWLPITMVLICLNSAVNPLIYSAMNPQYRAALVAAFQRKGHRKHLTNLPLAISKATDKYNLTNQTGHLNKETNV